MLGYWVTKMNKNGLYLEEAYKPVAFKSVGPNNGLGYEKFSM